MPESFEPDGLFFDRNGCLAERRWVDGHQVIVHYDDLPESDTTVVDGIPCTTALRTVIDIAVDVEDAHLEEIVRDCLTRRLFTVEEARSRISQPDLRARPGALRLGAVLRNLS